MTRLHRRNFLPAFIITTVLWILTFLWIVFVSPEWKITLNIFHKQFFLPLAIIIFFTIIFLCLFFTFSLLFGKVRRGVLISAYFFLILVLRLFKIGHWYNILILTLLLLVQEYYFISKKHSQEGV
jgi:hypothetical protein